MKVKIPIREITISRILLIFGVIILIGLFGLIGVFGFAITVMLAVDGYRIIGSIVGACTIILISSIFLNELELVEFELEIKKFEVNEDG